MTAASSDQDITQSTSEQRQLSSSSDHEWTRFLASLQPSMDRITTPLGSLALEESMSTQYDNMDNMMLTNALPATSASSAPANLDPNGALQQYPDWQHFQHDYSGYEQPPTQSTAWVPDQQQQQPQQVQQYDPNAHFMQARDGLGIQMAPTSHPAYLPATMQYDQPFMRQESPLDYSDDYRQDLGNTWNNHEHSVPPQDDLFADDDEAEPEDSTDPCYAQLLHKCLKEAPGHTMSLRELYDWVSKHSQKAKDLKNRGWQNSVRHNLSMNAVSVLSTFCVLNAVC